MSDREIAAITALHDAFGLTAKEAQVLIQLAGGSILPHVRIRDIYCDNPDTNPVEARSCIKRIRIKLRGTDITIKSHYGIGYGLEWESMKAVRQVISLLREDRSFVPSFGNKMVSTRTGASA